MTPHPIREVLRQKGYTQASFAREIGFSPFYVNHVVNGKWNPSEDFKAAASRTLGLSTDLLFYPTEGPVDPTQTDRIRRRKQRKEPPHA